MSLRFQNPNQWPKQLPELTEDQRRIREDFYNVWLTELPQRYGLIEKFNHTYPLRSLKSINHPVRTLDIGAGRGAHIAFEDLERQEYTALELRSELAQPITDQFPSVRVLIGDIQQRLNVSDGYFNRILAIHILEHLPDLPKALDEISRILHPTGYFSVLIPADPGLAYNLARRLSAKRIFEQRYKQPYDWFVACEHINAPNEIIGQLKNRFKIVNSKYFPLTLPIIPINLVIGLTLQHQDANQG